MGEFPIPVDNPAFYSLFYVLKELGIPSGHGRVDQLDYALQLHRGLKNKSTTAAQFTFDSPDPTDAVLTLVKELTAENFADLILPRSFSGLLISVRRVVYYNDTEIVAVATIYRHSSKSE